MIKACFRLARVCAWLQLRPPRSEAHVVYMRNRHGAAHQAMLPAEYPPGLVARWAVLHVEALKKAMALLVSSMEEALALAVDMGMTTTNFTSCATDNCNTPVRTDRQRSILRAGQTDMNTLQC